MKKYKEVKTVRVEKKIEDIICDRCNKTVIRSKYSSYTPSWFYMENGNTFLVGGEGTDFEMDLCLDCSLELVSILRSKGYKVREVDWSA